MTRTKWAKALASLVLVAVSAGCILAPRPLRVGAVMSYSPTESMFDALAWDGLEQAREQFCVVPNLWVNETFDDFEPGIDYFVHKPFDMVIAVGSQGAAASFAAAQAYPHIAFVTVDVGDDHALPNLAGVVFEIGESSFLAGYLAAGMSRTGKVATQGGMNIPPVVAFMEGFADGVAHYNKTKGTNVEVLGMDAFGNSFDDESTARAIADQQLADGADVLFPASGDATMGALKAVAAAGNAYFIGVDDDWAIAAPQYAAVILSSVMKHLDVAVLEMVRRKVEGEFDNEDFVGTLENNGVGLAPYHNCESVIPNDLKQEIDALAKNNP